MVSGRVIEPPLAILGPESILVAMLPGRRRREESCIFLDHRRKNRRWSEKLTEDEKLKEEMKSEYSAQLDLSSGSPQL
jgi:hypothetical protein